MKIDMSNHDTRYTRELEFTGTLVDFQEYLESLRQELEEKGCTSFSIGMVETIEGDDYSIYVDKISMIGIKPESETEKFNRLKREKMKEESERAREIGLMKHYMQKYKDELSSV